MGISLHTVKTNESIYTECGAQLPRIADITWKHSLKKVHNISLPSRPQSVLPASLWEERGSGTSDPETTAQEHRRHNLNPKHAQAHNNNIVQIL